jgi:hypothetical protein
MENTAIGNTQVWVLGNADFINARQSTANLLVTSVHTGNKPEHV